MSDVVVTVDRCAACDALIDRESLDGRTDEDCPYCGDSLELEPQRVDLGDRFEDWTRTGDEPKETALANVRDALAAAEDVPAVAVAGDSHDILLTAVESLRTLEGILANEVEQLRERSGGDDDA